MNNIQKLLLAVSVLLIALVSLVFFTGSKAKNLFYQGHKVKVRHTEASAGTDYSANITGTWAWIAQDISPEKNIIGMGTLDLVEDNKKKIWGQVASIIPLNGIAKDAPVQKASYLTTTSEIINGARLEGDKAIFQTKSYDQITSNKVAIKNNGHNLFGKSSVGVIINGTEVPAEYQWTATRISN